MRKRDIFAPWVIEPQKPLTQLYLISATNTDWQIMLSNKRFKIVLYLLVHLCIVK